MSIYTLPDSLQMEINNLKVEIIVGPISALTLQPTIFKGTKGSQKLDLDPHHIRENVMEGSNTEFSLLSDEY